MATNFFPSNGTVKVALSDDFGNAVLIRCTVANLPSAVAGYAVSCIAQTTDGGIYQNTGSATSATFTLMDTAATSLQLPEAATDATTTTGVSLDLTMNAVTTGQGLLLTANGLTTGEVISVVHTTAVIADGGSLIRASSTSIDTGGTTNGTLLDLKSTAQLAGTTVRLDTILTTGTAASIISTGVMTTTGNLLTLTANSATTAAGLLRVSGNALTDGIGAVISSSSAVLTSTGRLLSVSHSGAATVSGIISEVSSAAADETVIFKVTASAALAAGIASQVSVAAMTTGTGLAMTDANALTTGTMASFVSNSSDATARTLVNIKNDHASAVGAIPLTITQDAPINTNFFKGWVVNGVTFYVGNGTTSPNTVVTGAAGDVAFNCDSSKSYFCTGTTNWTAFA